MINVCKCKFAFVNDLCTEIIYKTIKNLRFSAYKGCLVKLCLDNLQFRRVKADVVVCYKLMHILVINMNSTKFITLSSNTQLGGNHAV